MHEHLRGGSMEQSKMLEARQLIEQKRYTEARQILETVDQPKARDWIQKIDAILYGDPFVNNPVAMQVPPQVQPVVSASAALLPAVAAVMSQYDWELKMQMHDTIQFQKRKGPNTLLSAIVIVLFSLLGTLIVCAAIATAKMETVTFQPDGRGGLRVTSSKGTYTVKTAFEVEPIAKSVGRSATYASAIIGGLLIFGITYFCLLSSYRY